ncbi:MAG: hypothetical protein M3R72_03380, partial [Bacteroidota bacterium]|nr:hypothetical protein [Bacteroidota bacterium]
MKRIVCLLLALSTMATQFANAQTCPATGTYTNQSGTFDLTSGKTILLNGGKKYQIAIQNDFSSTSSICVLNGSTLNLSFQSINSIQSGGKIYVDKNATLTINGSGITNFPLTLTNNGTVTQQSDVVFTDGAVINNTGSYTAQGAFTFNGGTILLTNSGTFLISGNTTFNGGTATMTNTATGNLTFNQDVISTSLVLNNQGTTTYNGNVILQSSGAINNSGIIYIQKNSNLTVNDASVTNKGVMYVYGTALFNGPANFTNTCTFKCYNTFTSNASNVNNTGSILLDVTSQAGTFINQGNFTNGSNGFVQGYNFTNNGGSITGGGNFYFSGKTINQGTFAGTSATNKINFYDASLTSSSNYFDIQTQAPTNTTKNKISPNTATTFTTCTDVLAPVITAQPVTQSFCTISTNTATFSVTATSNTTPTYQWYKNGAAISGAKASSYTATGLTLADTANSFTAAVINTFGSTTSSAASVNYIIVAQPTPAQLYIATGSSASFTVSASNNTTGYQWQVAGKKINKATYPSYTNSSVAFTDAGSYSVILTYPGGTCTSNPATLTVENLPTIITQPATQSFCTSATTTATFSVTAATSISALSYQWYKNDLAISGATASSYTATGLTLADTANTYYVILKNGIGSITSNTVSVKYVIVSQPTPAQLYSATGSSATFTVKGSAIVTGYQWQMSGKNIGGATTPTYTKSSIALTDAGTYTVALTYSGSTCTTTPATLTVENLPLITAQPQKQVLCSSSITSATFSVTADKSVSNLTYQWYKNGAAISGATANSLNLSNLTFADTSSTYYVLLTNGVGSITSNNVFVKYVILNQPSNLYLGVGATASFNVVTSGATGYQWQKANANISGGTSATYSKTNILLSDAGSYTTVVSYLGGTCTSNAAILTVESLPSITLQPQQQVLCSSSTTATFSVTAVKGVYDLTYQWYKNNSAVSGATSSSYSPAGLTMADTTNTYYVAITNGIGTVKSNSVNFKYLITSQPLSQVVATGNSVSFSVGASGIVSYLWQKNGVSISGATGSTYTLPVVNYSDAAKYSAQVLFNGASCISNAAVLQPSIVLYSKASGNFNLPSTWGVATDGSGSSPVDFTRSEHTFVVANRSSLSTAGTLTIAGTVDVANGTLIITPGTTLTAGRIIRSLSTGVIAGSSSSNLSLTGIATINIGSSDLYFDAINDTLHNLTIASQTVTLHTALNIT